MQYAPPSLYTYKRSTLVMSLYLFLLLGIGSLQAQHRLEIEVRDIPKIQGLLRVALYNSDKTFLSFDQVMMAKSEAIHGHTVLLSMEDVPEGEYAVAIFHDKNGNGKLDKNFLGIPKEAFAFSNASMKLFGPPRFEDCSFEVVRDTNIRISF